MSLYDQLLDLLDQSPLIRDHATIETKTVDEATFSFKVRATITDELTLQIRYLHDGGFVRYSYQLFSTEPVLRWDNAPHFPDLPGFPHHFHDDKGNRRSSPLRGNLLSDIAIVLSEIEKYVIKTGSDQ
ncbi:MAG: DUF6516 family protein [Acidobacteriota bacterium]